MALVIHGEKAFPQDVFGMPMGRTSCRKASRHRCDVTAASVSVVIPCYNGAAFLRETLESALKQTHPPLEVLVIDDGSTDESAEIAESFGPPVRVIRQKNQGESVARNRGIEEANGHWIAFLDADDYWASDKLECQLAVVDEQTVAVHTNLYFFGSREGTTQIENVPPDVRYSFDHLVCSNSFVTPSAVMTRRSQTPVFPVWTRHAEDQLFFLELVQRGQIKFIPEPLTGYRKHGNNQSAGRTKFLHWFESVDRWLREFSGLGPSRVEELRQACVRNLCRKVRRLKRKRQWNEFVEARAYLQQLRGFKEADALLSQRTYPRWVYACADRMSEAVGVRPRRQGK